MKLRKSQERGYFENNWLKSHHTFSFGEYYDPRHMHYRSLRVINHDVIAAGAGFPPHPHRDMEIITYVLRGAVAHQDSMGNKERVNAGEVQVMSAGDGVRHSEFNPEPEKDLELLQIWLLPHTGALPPSYAQQVFSEEQKKNRLCLIASGNDADQTLKIHQDVRLYASILEKEKQLEFAVGSDRGVWLQVAQGQIEVNGQQLESGDGLSVEGHEAAVLRIKGLQGQSEFLLFDLK